MPFKDPEKRRIYRRYWYSQNKKSEIVHIKRRKKALKKWLAEYKLGLKCERCPENHPSTLDFHHINKNKEAGITVLVSNGRSITNIKKEIDKCIVLCSNCHRKEHYNKNL